MFLLFKAIKWLLMGLAALVVLIPLAALVGESRQRPQPAAYATTAEDLFRLFDANEVSADQAVAGRIVAVSGVVQAIETDLTGAPLLHLASPNPFLPVRAQLVDADKPRAAGLVKGQAVTVWCPRVAQVVGSPAGFECRL